MSVTTDPQLRHDDPADTKLKDPIFVKQMIATLSPGLFELADLRTSQDIIAACKAHCDGSREVLSRVLQSKFIGNHSPFYWALNGVEELPTAKKLPPLLAQLLLVSGKLSLEIQEEILDALFRIENNALFQLLQVHLSELSNPIDVDNAFVSKPATIVASGGVAGRFTFNIPQLPDRLLMDSEIVLPTYLSKGSLWSFKAAVTNSGPSSTNSGPIWGFILDEVRAQYPTVLPNTNDTDIHVRRVTVTIHSAKSNLADLELRGRSDATDPKKAVHTQVKTTRILVTDGRLASFHGNRFLGAGRTLSGTVTITDNVERKTGRF